jgi:pathogenesis-related protein 1
MKRNSYLITVMFLIPFITAAQNVPVETGSKVSQEQAQAALDYHNKVRADVGSPPLQWSQELSKFAQAWAENLAASNCKMEHRPASGKWAQKYGENIFWGAGEEYTAKHASESWYSEIKDYKYGPLKGNNWYKTGHYTQMVWKNTTHVGMGIAYCKNGAVIIVANYNPPGNYMGEKPY